MTKKEKIKHEEIMEIASEKKEEIEPPEKKKKISHEEQKLIESIEQRIGELEAQLKRVQAEFENYRKRTDREREMLLMAGSAGMIEKLLPVVGDMEVAIDAIHHKASAKEIKEGMEMLYKKFHSLLEKEGLSEMNLENQLFDPYMHEAIRRVEGDTDGKIVEVLKKGYLFKGNVLRHAMVVVSKKKEETKEEEKKEEKEKGEEK
jgi:molecular chaperone GrpE